MAWRVHGDTVQAALVVHDVGVTPWRIPDAAAGMHACGHFVPARRPLPAVTNFTLLARARSTTYSYAANWNLYLVQFYD